MISNKRRHDRYSCDILAQVSYYLTTGKWASLIKDSFTGRARDVSSQGVKIEIDRVFLDIPISISVGDSVEVDIFLLGFKKITFTAVVRHVEDGSLGGQLLCFPLQSYHKEFNELIALTKSQQTNQQTKKEETQQTALSNKPTN